MRRHTDFHQHLFSLSNLVSFATICNVVRATLPSVDFDRMGSVGLAGSFAGLDFFNTTEVTFDVRSSTLLARAQDGSLTKVGSTNDDGVILAGCSSGGKFYFGGSFTSVGSASASNAALYDPSKGSFSALGGGGLDGNVTAIYCNATTGDIWFGGEFTGPTTGTTGYAGSVAVYDSKADKWSPPPFAGLDGPVYSIITSPTSSSSLLFAGAFHTSFSAGSPNISPNNNPNVTFSLGATPFSLSLVPIPLSSADIDASPSSQQSDFANISNILCPIGPDGPGFTWLALDGFQPFITIRTFSALTASGIRLGNTFVQGRGTKTFTVTTLPDNKVLTLNYTDPTDHQVKTCSDTCILLQDQSIPYQDFLIAPNDGAFTGLQISLAQWTGAGPGLHLLQILSNGAFASSASNQPASCFAPGASTTQQTGTWTPVDVGTNFPATEQTVLVSHVDVGTPPDQGPTFTWKPYVSATGLYNVNLLIPGCTNLQDCALRTTVKVTINPGNGLQPVSTTVNQQVASDTTISIYNGPIIPTSPGLTTSIMLELDDQPTGNGQNGQYELVVDRVQLQLISVDISGNSSSSTEGYSSSAGQAGFGIFDWSLSRQSSESVNATGVLPNSTETSVDAIGIQLASSIGSRSGSVIRTVALHSSGSIFLGGNFTAAAGTNIVGFKNNALFGLQDNGLDGSVHSLAVSGDILYVGGEFQDTLLGSGKGAFRGVVSYDIQNNKWNALQAGVNGAVSSLDILNDQVLIAGNFTTLPSRANGTSGVSSPGFAAWDIVHGAWAQSGGYLNGAMTFIGNGTSFGTGFLAGNVEASLKVGSDGFVTISNGRKGGGPEITPLKIQLDGAPNSTPSTGSSSIARWRNIFTRQSGPSALPNPASEAAPAILAGVFWKNSTSNKQVTILGGNFTFSSGSISASSLAFYDSESEILTPAVGSQVNGTVYTLLVQGNQLFVGGSFTLSGSAQGGNGFAIYDLDKQQWDGTAIQALQGPNLLVRSITVTSFKSNTIYVAGNFTGAGSLATCQGICALDLNSKQWSALGGGIQGEVASVDYAATDFELLIAGGSINLNGSPANVAMFAIANSTWSAVGDSSQIGGVVTALTVNGQNASSIFAAGPSSGGSFLSFWNGIKWTSVDNSSLGSSSIVQQLLMLPLQEDHSANSVIESDRILMISGSLRSINASSALFDGQSFTPYIVTTSPTGSLGSISSLFHSLTQFSFDRKHFLATGVVILISIAISAGIVFLILLIGVIWTLCIRHHEADNGKFVGYDEEDVDSVQGPSSLLEHINAATRSTILGAGAMSPFDSSAAQKETRTTSPRLGNDDDPFAAETSEGGHMALAARSNEDAPIGTAIGGETDEEPRQTRVRYSFDGTGEGELPLSSGAEVEVLDSHDSAWWYVKDSNGREGVVPASYLY